MIIKPQVKSLISRLTRESRNKLTTKQTIINGPKAAVSSNHQAQKIVIDFSSPNIAKPFHFGHLKSTILGNFLANLNTYLGNNVTKLNYVGDWGTQYGLLNLGLSEFPLKNGTSTPTEERSVLRHLVDVYVKANEKGAMDESFFADAKQRFLRLEQDPVQFEKWKKIRDLSLNELTNSYSQMGIEFDVYEFESDYAKTTTNLIDRLRQFRFIRVLDDGAIVADILKNNRALQVPVQRSDGASLYLTRDIAAALKRKEEFNFDKMLYVVGTDQERHFYCLKEILRQTGCDWSDNLTHVRFGKVLGMSTRSGNFVLLTDIINETTKQYIEYTKNTPTSKAKSAEDIATVGSQLAMSALFVYDMRNRRVKNYTFEWDGVMYPGDRSGIQLQTTYARLASLRRRALDAGIETIQECELNYDALCCDEAVSLLSDLNDLNTALQESYLTMDPAPLVNHALGLCKSINRARKSNRLWVLGDSDVSEARARLTMFELARDQLEFIIKIIGLRPLEQV